MYSLLNLYPVFKDLGASKLVSFIYNQSIDFISISCFQFIYFFYALNFACILLNLKLKILKYDVAFVKHATENNQDILIEAVLEDRPFERLLYMSKSIQAYKINSNNPKNNFKN